jgi:hypothetical protein
MKLKFDEFLRSVAISKNDTYALLLGSGCSISSDIKSAYDCIWDLEKIIYKSNNPNTEDWIENYKNPKVQALSKIRDTLLPKLLSGELRITEAEKCRR